MHTPRGDVVPRKARSLLPGLHNSAVPLGNVEWPADIQRRSEVIGEGTALGGGTVDMDS